MPAAVSVGEKVLVPEYGGTKVVFDKTVSSSATIEFKNEVSCM